MKWYGAEGKINHYFAQLATQLQEQGVPAAAQSKGRLRKVRGAITDLIDGNKEKLMILKLTGEEIKYFSKELYDKHQVLNEAYDDDKIEEFAKLLVERNREELIGNVKAGSTTEVHKMPRYRRR